MPLWFTIPQRLQGGGDSRAQSRERVLVGRTGQAGGGAGGGWETEAAGEPHLRYGW